MDSITFNTTENKIVVTLTDGTEQTYTNAQSYLADWPNRKADVIAMGWESDNVG